jgi:predicted Zn-dependent protease
MKTSETRRTGTMNTWRLPVLLLVLALGLGACGTNPVTGKQELGFVSEQQERSIGQKNYAPYRQQQGGDYVADKALVNYVQSVGKRLAKVSDRKLDYEFQVVNDGTPNAWALPGGKIAIHRGLLLELQSEAELAAVLGHEIVHAAARHTARSMERGTLLQGAILLGNLALSGSEYSQLGSLGLNVGAGLTQKHYGRDAEREADAYGMRYMKRAGYDPIAAVHLQETFVRLHDGKEPNWLAGLFATHPPSPERVRNNQKLLAKLGKPGGDLGKARYQKAIAHLRKTQKAYEHYAKASEAAAKKQYAQALGLLDKALNIEPQEALFHGLRGDIRQQQKRYQDAMVNYDRALRYNPEYYAFYLSRGVLHQKQKQLAEAQRDLQKSIQLLPTGEAYLSLGLLAQTRGLAGQAQRYYREAARFNSAAGQQARQRLKSVAK